MKETTTQSNECFNEKLKNHHTDIFHIEKRKAVNTYNLGDTWVLELVPMKKLLDEGDILWHSDFEYRYFELF